METQKAVFLIVGVFVAGLVLGYIFSGGADTTGQAQRNIEGSGSSGGSLTCYCRSDYYASGCRRTIDPKIVICGGGSTHLCNSGWFCL